MAGTYPPLCLSGQTLGILHYCPVSASHFLWSFLAHFPCSSLLPESKALLPHFFLLRAGSSMALPSMDCRPAEKNPLSFLFEQQRLQGLFFHEGSKAS